MPSRVVGDVKMLMDTIPVETPTSRPRAPRQSRPRVAGALRIVVLSVSMLAFIIPLWWLLLAPTKTSDQLSDRSRNPLAFGSFTTLSETWGRLASFADGVIGVWLLNSLTYAGATAALAVVLCVPAGYALASYDFPGRRLLLSLTLVSMIVPAAALVLPLYLQMAGLGLVNTAWAVVLPGALFPFGVYLAYLYYRDNLPRSLVEAARLDGCGEFTTFRLLGLPLGGPAIGLVAFFSFVAAWTNFFLPYVMFASDDKYPLQLGLAVLMSTTAAVNPINGLNDLGIGAPEAALAADITVLPLLIAFLIAQRRLGSGVIAGSVKG